MNANTADVYLQIQVTDDTDIVNGVLDRTGQIPGVVTATLKTRVSHLLTIEYDPKQISSYAILNTVRKQGYMASLV